MVLRRSVERVLVYVERFTCLQRGMVLRRSVERVLVYVERFTYLHRGVFFFSMRRSVE